MDSNTAVCWCAAGAIERIALKRGIKSGDLWDLYEALSVLSERHTGCPSLIFVNDNRGRLAALSVIDAAIAELEAQS